MFYLLCTKNVRGHIIDLKPTIYTWGENKRGLYSVDIYVPTCVSNATLNQGQGRISQKKIV